MAGTVYQGDVGLEIVLDCGCDVSGAVGAAVAVRTPSGAVVAWPAETAAAGGGGVTCLRCLTRAGDLAEAGTYRLQASLTLGGWTGRGRTAILVVKPKFS
ncbi:hypothetical protein DFW101_3035 [Solidesulfovibrio carbinoliphilus subsp. oakridgensis]|uniref:Uncharacterized protein n=1 Tax=Solidesulfovibrio carbinoliphilus subsp. oakridgensis TaxID=694327 RepID=G7Q778_9BACT|nr:hypothetical protein [Solidesulfovibrio carbinoliphilus]EHJ49035.1 hypothetical protein DFW101_3035 [Solidesulfovibrio carbinoliphilus subsp. oakridgensis]